jgi:hypothetical protein
MKRVSEREMCIWDYDDDDNKKCVCVLIIIFDKTERKRISPLFTIFLLRFDVGKMIWK